MRVAVIAGELIDANVRLRLMANRTYGLAIRSLFRKVGFLIQAYFL